MRVMLSKHTYTHKGTVALKQQISVTPKTSGLSQVWNFFNPSFPGFSIVGCSAGSIHTTTVWIS